MCKRETDDRQSTAARLRTVDSFSGKQPVDTLSAVFDDIDLHAPVSIERLLTYASRPSISAQGIGIADVASLLQKEFVAMGLDAQILPSKGNPVVVASWNGKPGLPTVLLYGHYDVQPPEPLDAWISPPFEPTIRDGRIFARGIGDNKGQHFAQMLAIESHLRVNKELPCNVVFLIDGEEEVGSPSLSSFVRANRERLRADLVVTADGSLHPSGSPIVQFGVRGLLTFELLIHSAKRDVHSGNFGGIVPNAAWKLVHLLSTMKNENGDITIDGINDGVHPPSIEDIAAISKLPIDLNVLRTELGIAALDAPTSRGYFERLMFHPTLTINGIKSGYSGPGMKTVIPHEASAKCDMRLVGDQTPDHVFELVAEHVRRNAPDVEVIRTNSIETSKTPLTSPFADLISDAILRARGQRPLLYPLVGGSLPEYVFTKTLGLPSFLIPYANADQANHAPNENLRIECFLDGIRTGAALLSYLGANNLARTADTVA